MWINKIVKPRKTKFKIMKGYLITFVIVVAAVIVAHMVEKKVLKTA